MTMLAFQFFLEAVIPMTTYGNTGEDVLWACLVVAVVGILSNIRRMQTIALFCSWAVPGTVTMYLRNSGMPDSTIFAISAILFFGVYVLDWLLLQAAVADGVPETAVMTAINFFGSMAAVQLTRSLQSTDSVQTFLIVIVLLYCTALMLDQVRPPRCAPSMPRPQPPRVRTFCAVRTVAPWTHGRGCVTPVGRSLHSVVMVERHEQDKASQ